MNRRDFLKAAGAGAAAAGLGACTGGKRNSSTELDEGMVITRRIGDEEIGILGFGGMRWKMIKDADGNDIVDQEYLNTMVDYAIEHGVNYFDSAPVYLQGQSQGGFAKALQRHPRESYKIATKLSNQKAGNDYEVGINIYKESLRIYNTDYLDFYLLHAVGGLDAFNKRFKDNGLIDYLLKEREEGRIRHLGFSFHGDREGFDEMMQLHETYHWDFVQIQMNYVDWTHAAGGNTNADYLYAELVRRGIPVIVMEPILGGRLANLPDKPAGMLKEKEPSMSLASWGFRFAASYPGVLTILSGMGSFEHLQDNVRTLSNFKPLGSEEMEYLESVAGIIRDYPLVNCTACEYCMPCPYGIDIPGIFKHYNNCVNSSFIAESAEQKDFKKLRRKYLVSYGREIEISRQADHCIGCAKCVPRCPQHIAIPGELRRIDTYIEKLKQETL